MLLVTHANITRTALCIARRLSFQVNSCLTMYEEQIALFIIVGFQNSTLSLFVFFLLQDGLCNTIQLPVPHNLQMLASHTHTQTTHIPLPPPTSHIISPFVLFVKKKSGHVCVLRKAALRNSKDFSYTRQLQLRK